MTPEVERKITEVKQSITIDLKSNPDLIQTLDGAKSSRKRELAGEERYKVVRNFFLGEVDLSLTDNMGRAKDGFIYDGEGNKITDARSNPLRFNTIWTSSKLTAEGQVLPQGKEPSLLKFLEEKFKQKTQAGANKAESKVDAFLRKARDSDTGAKLTGGERKIAEEKFYLKQLGYFLKLENWLKGFGKAVFKDQKVVRILKKEDGKPIEKDGKPLEFKLNLMNGLPSNELMEFLRERYIEKHPEEKEAVDAIRAASSRRKVNEKSVEPVGKSKKEGFWKNIFTKHEKTPKQNTEEELAIREKAKQEAKEARQIKLFEERARKQTKREIDEQRKLEKERVKKETEEAKKAKQKARIIEIQTRIGNIKAARQKAIEVKKAKRTEMQARIKAVLISNEQLKKAVNEAKELFIDGKFDEAEHLLIKYGYLPEELRKYFISWGKEYVYKNLNRKLKGVEEEIQREIKEKELNGLEAEEARGRKYENVLGDLLGGGHPLSRDFVKADSRLRHSKIYKSIYPDERPIEAVPKDKLKKYEKVSRELEKYRNQLLKKEVKFQLRKKLEIEIKELAVQLRKERKWFLKTLIPQVK